MGRIRLGTEKSVTECKIGDKILRYDACSESRDAYIEQEMKYNWVYIGFGKIFKISGHVQTFDETHHFWTN